MKTKPDLGFWKLWNLSFGFFGVQIAYALQSSQVSRIFSTIGADPHQLSYFWILPPLMGMLVQPIVGSASDRTWNRFGRRLPYLLLGAAIAIVVMCFLPNAGSLGLSSTSELFLSMSPAVFFGLTMLMLLDTSINMAMQPFKMLVGDMVNEKQKGLAYSIQSFLCNAGSVVGYLAPIVLALFLSNTAPQGEVPPTVTWAFYIGAAILVLCVLYTFAKVKELPPHEYAQYNGVVEQPKGKRDNMFKLLKKAPKVFWTVGLVQFFCWAAFLYMWSYSTDAIAGSVFETPSVNKVSALTIDGQQYDLKGKVLFAGETIVVDHGDLNADAEAFENAGPLTIAGRVVESDGVVTKFDTEEIPAATFAQFNDGLHYETVLNAQSEQYQEAGNWNGILLAVQGMIAVLWAIVLPRFRNRRAAYSISLLIGAVGFLSIWFITDKWILLFSYGLVGCAWAAMLAMPFTILTNALSGGNIGTYLGLFNCTICLPQIVAAVVGGSILSLAPALVNGAPKSTFMLAVAGILLLLGSLAVWIVKETSGSNSGSADSDAIKQAEIAAVEDL